ncbi:hypothetical protein CP356_06680 [Lactobacillus sp. UMNPBX5]|nr:hypothetical protein CP356_06680 [Lactobacillus sp. UMNPBX5]
MNEKINANDVIKALQQELSDKQLENAILKAQLVTYQQTGQKDTEDKPAKEDVTKPEQDQPAQIDPNFANTKDGE